MSGGQDGVSTDVIHAAGQPGSGTSLGYVAPCSLGQVGMSLGNKDSQGAQRHVCAKRSPLPFPGANVVGTELGRTALRGKLHRASDQCATVWPCPSSPRARPWASCHIQLLEAAPGTSISTCSHWHLAPKHQVHGSARSLASAFSKKAPSSHVGNRPQEGTETSREDCWLSGTQVHTQGRGGEGPLPAPGLPHGLFWDFPEGAMIRGLEALSCTLS